MPETVATTESSILRVTLLLAPPSTISMPVPPVSTLSSVRVAFNASVTYCAFVGAPPPAVGADIVTAPFDADVISTLLPAMR